MLNNNNIYFVIVFILKEKFINAYLSSERLEILKNKNSIDFTKQNDNIKEWLNVRSLVSENVFNDKLNYESIKKDEFNYSIKKLNNKEKEILSEELKECEWYKLFQEIMSIFEKSETKELHNDFLNSGAGYVIRPYIYYFKAKINVILGKCTNLEITDNAKNEMINSTMIKVFGFFSKVFVLELNSEKEKFIGNSQEERFQNFLISNYNSKNKLYEFYSRYPVCTRLAVTKISYLIRAFSEAYSRLNYNFDKINLELFDGDLSNKVVGMKCSEGDSHQEGRSVIIFELDNYNLVYKPRNLKVVESYNKFINWINKNSGLLDLLENKGIYYDKFTFEKFVQYKDCSSEKEVKNYYTRFGQLIAVAYEICGNDFHLENLIANGEYPVLIDLETIIQGVFYLSFNDRVAIKIKNDLYVNSVMNTSLLPVIAFNDNLENKGMDISALNGREQKLPYKVLVPTNMNTENFRYEYKEVIREGASNLPRLNGENVNFIDYVDYIINGFEKMMQFFIENKSLMLADNGILKVFNNLIVRNVIKGTNKYMQLLGFSSHPNYSNDMLKREKLFENMWAYPYKNKAVVKYEIKDIIFDDVPVFFSNTSSRNLISSKGEVVIDFFEKSGYECMIDRIKGLTNKEYLKQRSILLVSLGKYNEEVLSLKGNRDYLDNRNENIDLLLESKSIADNLLLKSISSDSKDGISWSDVVLKSSGDWEVSALGESIYSGLSGIALFLYELYNSTNDYKYYYAYKKVMNEAIMESQYIDDISAYSGKVSLLFPILNEYQKSGQSYYYELIDKTMEFIRENIGSIKSYDWLSGYSGLIVSVLNVYDCINDNKYLELAKDLGEKLINSVNIKEINVVGLAHGLTGIALASVRLNKYINDSLYLEFALDALKREREIWQEFKLEESKWCKGWTGIGIGRLEILDYYKDDNLLDDINLSLKNIIDKNKKDDCICHGNMGDIIFLNMYTNKFNNKDIDVIKNIKINDVITMKNNSGKYSVRNLPEFISVDLFTGESGIGYGLLKVLNSETSNILTLKL